MHKDYFEAFRTVLDFAVEKTYEASDTGSDTFKSRFWRSHKGVLGLLACPDDWQRSCNSKDSQVAADAVGRLVATRCGRAMLKGDQVLLDRAKYQMYIKARLKDLAHVDFALDAVAASK